MDEEHRMKIHDSLRAYILILHLLMNFVMICII